MKSPSTPKIFLYQYITLGIYFFVWCYRLGNELSESLQRKAVPSMWWFIVPGGVYYWMWQMAESLDVATGHRIQKTTTFLLYLLLTGASAGYGIQYNTSTDSITASDAQLFLAVLLTVLALVAFLGITLHAIFMSVIQAKIRNVRAG